MRTVLLGILIAFWASATLAQDARGLWRTEMTERGYVEIRMGACGANLCGIIERARSPEGVEGPYEHVGERIVWDMAPDGAGQWSGGKIWDPRNGRTFNSRMALEGGVLVVSGCFLGICQSQNWLAVN